MGKIITVVVRVIEDNIDKTFSTANATKYSNITLNDLDESASMIYCSNLHYTWPNNSLHANCSSMIFIGHRRVPSFCHIHSFDQFFLI